MKNPLESIAHATAESHGAEKEPHHRRKTAFTFRLTGIHLREKSDGALHRQLNSSGQESKVHRNQSSAQVDLLETGKH